MTRGALPPCLFPLARGALASCMGLEGTWVPVLHPSPLSHRQLPFLTHARLWLLVCNPLMPLSPQHPLGQPHPLLHPAGAMGLRPNPPPISSWTRTFGFLQNSPPQRLGHNAPKRHARPLHTRKRQRKVPNPRQWHEGRLICLGLHHGGQLAKHDVQLGGGPLARATCHVPPPCSQHGNIVPHLGHGRELHARANTGQVLKGDVVSQLDPMRHFACQHQCTSRNLPIPVPPH